MSRGWRLKRHEQPLSTMTGSLDKSSSLDSRFTRPTCIISGTKSFLIVNIKIMNKNSNLPTHHFRHTDNFQPVGNQRLKWSSAPFHNDHKLLAAILMAAVESRVLAHLKVIRFFFTQKVARLNKNN
jgi:hypothetical protein